MRAAAAWRSTGRSVDTSSFLRGRLEIDRLQWNVEADGEDLLTIVTTFWQDVCNCMRYRRSLRSCKRTFGSRSTRFADAGDGRRQ